MSVLIPILLAIFLTAGITILAYIAFLGAMLIPSFQSSFLYLHRPKPATLKELNKPERFGFLYKQVTPFSITTTDNIQLYAWHVLPLNIYRRNAEELIRQNSPLVQDFTQTLNFHLLQNDPDARLIISMHGTAGNLASGGRPHNYRVLSSSAPDIHILAFDYRGFGLSSGKPSESGLLRDAIAIFKWATEDANIPPERIVLFGHSLGSAVAIALANHLACQTPSISCAGLVITGAFLDLLTLSKTYHILGLRIFFPITKIQSWSTYYARHLPNTWLNQDRVAEYIRRSSRYHITFIHAENDPVVPATHSSSLFWRAVKATKENGMSYDELQNWRAKEAIQLGEGDWAVEWRTENGLIRQDMLKRGGHNMITLYSVVQDGILRAFQSSDHRF